MRKKAEMPKRNGRRVYIGEGGVNKHGNRLVRTMCDCGSAQTVPASNYKRSLSCGCHSADSKVGNDRNRKHGLSSNRLYHTWSAMVRRCSNPSDNAFSNYGGRGITVCEEWLGSEGLANYVSFIESLDGHDNPKLTIDRVDNNKGYSPDNVRLADRVTQNTNQRKRRDAK